MGRGADFATADFVLKQSAGLISRASQIENLRLGLFAVGNVVLANFIISAEASTPMTAPRGTAREISADTLPSPQPTSKTCSSPRSFSRAMSSRAQLCCTAEFA